MKIEKFFPESFDMDNIVRPSPAILLILGGAVLAIVAAIIGLSLHGRKVRHLKGN